MAVIEALRRHAVDCANHLAFAGDGLRLDYTGLFDRVSAGAAALAVDGIGPGSVVGLTVADEVEHLVASFALLAVGARQIVLATHDPAPSRAALAAEIGMTHVVTSADIAPLPGLRQVVWPPRGEIGGLGHAPAHEGEILLKTSGTTGGVKIVVFSAAQLATQAWRHSDYIGERLLRLASVEHNNSKRHRLYCAIVGGTNVFRPKGGLDVVDFCLRNDVSCLDISLMHAANLAARPDAGRLRALKLRPGGSAVPADVRQALLTRVTDQLYVRYATTESAAISHAGPGEHDDDESAGTPLPGVDLQIVDAEGLAVAPGETGHIRLRVAGMATGYLNNPAQTALHFRDGWFWPGDMGRFRADGSLVVRGRHDDMMILNGLNVFPAEIERVLERHPSVRRAAALPLKSAVHGQIPVAAVELADGAAAVTPFELQRFAKQHLALRTPRRILIMPALPMNGGGKIMRGEIARAFELSGAASR